MVERKIKTLKKYLREPSVEKMKAIHNIECETYLPRHLTLFSRLLLSIGVPALRIMLMRHVPQSWHAEKTTCDHKLSSNTFAKMEKDFH